MTSSSGPRKPRSTDHWTAPSVQASGTAVTQNHRDEGSKRSADPLEASPSHLPAQSIDAARLEVTSRVKAPRQGPPTAGVPPCLLFGSEEKNSSYQNVASHYQENSGSETLDFVSFFVLKRRPKKFCLYELYLSTFTSN